jgi:hypothetical protein
MSRTLRPSLTARLGPIYDRCEMWVVREFLRLLFRIAVAVAIASAIAGIKAFLSGGDALHTWKITLIALGCLMLLLSMAGNRGTASNRRLNQGVDHASTFVMRIPGLPPTNEGPTLTATAMFIGTAVALFVLAALA